MTRRIQEGWTVDGSAMSLKLKLDEESLEVLETLAGAQRCSVEELVTSLVRKAIRAEQKARRPKPSEPRDAPMDAFLPEGADPFATHDSMALASSFADVQTRMRFAGTPSLFRENESN